MVTYTEPKPRIATGAESEFDRNEKAMPRPEVRVTQTNRGSGGTIAYVIAALVLIIGGYLLYTNNWSQTTVVPTVTQNNTTLPAPDTITPVPVTPPAAEKTAPPATVPATPGTTTTVQ
ncbi:MAG: hypothetical protein WCB71_02605 [Aestuariivirga sp.]